MKDKIGNKTTCILWGMWLGFLLYLLADRVLVPLLEPVPANCAKQYGTETSEYQVCIENFVIRAIPNSTTADAE